MSDNGDCKIGRTAKNPEMRLKQLQTGASEKLSLVCFFKTRNAMLMERMLHNRHGARRKNGEWFTLTDNDIMCFVKQCEKFEETITALENNVYIKKRYDNER